MDSKATDRQATGSRLRVSPGGVAEQTPGLYYRGEIDKPAFTVSLGWVQGTCPDSERGRLLEWLGYWFGAWSERSKGLYGYLCGKEFVGGAIVLHGLHGERRECCLVVPQSAMEAWSLEDVSEFLCGLAAFNFRCSRLDTSIDDNLRSVSLDQVRESIASGELVGFRKVTDYREQRVLAGGRGVELTGDGLGFGSRGSSGSGRYVRIYDKRLESKGKRDCIRWEAEYSGQKAMTVYLLLLEVSDVDNQNDLRLRLAQLVTGALSFRAAAAGEGQRQHASRREDSAWWAEFKRATSEGIVIPSMPTKPATIERRQVWVKAAVGKSLAMLRLYMGEPSFDEFIRRSADDAESSLTGLERVTASSAEWYAREFESSGAAFL